MYNKNNKGASVRKTYTKRNGVCKENGKFRARKMINGTKYDQSFERKRDAIAYLKSITS